MSFAFASRARNRRLIAGGAAAAAVLALTVPAVAGNTSGVSLTKLTKDLPSWLHLATDKGELSSLHPLQVGITIARPDPAGEAALIKGLYNPKSATYHDFPTSTQWDRAFGVSVKVYDQVRSYAQRDGLKVISVDGSHDTVLLGGTAAQVEKTFNVTLDSYEFNGHSLYANTDAPEVPAGLGITTVTSLASDPYLHLADTPSIAADTTSSTSSAADVPAVIEQAVAKKKKPKANKQHNVSQHPSVDGPYKPQAGCNEEVVDARCVGVLQPAALYNLYKIPAYQRSGGQGESMGVIGEGAVEDTIKDLRLYEGVHHLPKMRINVDSIADKMTDNTGTDEWDLDTQSSTAMAPEAKQETLYFANSLDSAPLASAISAFVDAKNGPRQANMSIGECELLGAATDDPLIPAVSKLLTKAMALGKSLFVATGDEGGSCPASAAAINGIANDGAPSPEFPASDPDAVAVGGTVLESNGKLPAVRYDEYGWLYSGGGSSYVFPKSSWQKKATSSLTAVSSCPLGASATTTDCRDVPDISALSGNALVGFLDTSIDDNGFSTVTEGSLNADGGGTSLSSPIEMGLWTRIQAASKKVHGRYRGNGLATPLYYKIADNPKEDKEAFFDVGGKYKSEVTSNGQQLSMARSSLDPTGYDEVTGLGVPLIKPLMKLIDHRIKPTHATKQLKPDEHFKACPRPLGTYTDPSGDATGTPAVVSAPVSDPGLDITKAYIKYSKAKGTITFYTLVPSLSADAGPSVFRFLFGVDGVSWYGDVDTDAGAVTGEHIAAGSVTDPQQFKVPGISAGLSTAKGTVDFVLPVNSFNKALHLNPKLKPGSMITPLGVRSRDGVETHSTAVDVAFDAHDCGYVIPGGKHKHSKHKTTKHSKK